MADTKIRIGNDIDITWSILDADEQPYIVEGRNIAVELNVGKKRVRITEFDLHENQIHFVYYGKDQKYLGSYNLKFIENEGAVDMVTFDTEDAFRLMEHSWLAIDEGETPETVQVEVVTVSSELNSKVGPRGYSAYEIAVQNGFVGTEEEWLASLQGSDADVTAENIAAALGYTPYGKPNDGIPKSDLSSGVQTSLEKADTALQSETDPTVPSWAKQQDKPSYTPQEIGAQPTLESGVNIKTINNQSILGEGDITIEGGSSDAVLYTQQTLTTEQQSQARENIGAGTYSKPSGGIPATDIAPGVIPDVSNFITKSVNDLTNYYLKSETYTKDEVAALIGAIQQFHYEIYASTSAVTDPQTNVLYLIGPTGSGADKYEEYVYSNGFVKIGDTSLDLSGYVTTSALNTALADYTTTANLTTLLFAKEDNSNKVTSWGSTPSDTKYPSEKLVKESLDAKEDAVNKVTALSNANTDVQYPSAKAVYDSFYKRGVISQTQTWTRAADGGYDYVMSDLVYGDIPRANIDLYEAAGATFNATTGYFELNGLTDISYEEMKAIHLGSIGNLERRVDRSYEYIESTLRTVLPLVGVTYVGYMANITNMFMSARIENIAFPSTGLKLTPASGGFFSNEYYLRKVFGVIDVSSITSLGWNTFYGCASLTEISLKGLKSNIDFSRSPILSIASILYMINNEVATSGITIKLHATAYAAATADADVQAALTAHTNVTLASAT